jgi:hypothetical protein
MPDFSVRIKGHIQGRVQSQNHAQDLEFDTDLIWLIRPKNWVEQNISRTKSGQQLCSTNVYFDYFNLWNIPI